MSTATPTDPRITRALDAIQTLRDRARDKTNWPPVQNTEPRILQYLLTHSGSRETATTSRQMEEALGTTQSVVQKAIISLPGSLLLAGITEIKIHRFHVPHANGGHHYYITIER